MMHISDFPQTIYQGPWQEFLQSYQNNQLHHAWLILGEAGFAKDDFVRRLSAFLIDPRQRKQEITEISPMEFHPQFQFVDGVQDEDKKDKKITISVDDIRQLQSHLRMTSSDNEYKVAVISPADAMNNNAANALLKTLEEPAGKAVLFLVCQSLGSLPETIRSRCRILQIPMLKQEDVVAILQKKYPEIDLKKIEYTASLANNKLSMAIELMECDADTAYEDLLALLKVWPHYTARQVNDFAETYANRRDKKRFLAINQLFHIFLERFISYISHSSSKSFLALEISVFDQLKQADLTVWFAKYDEIKALDQKANLFHIDHQILLTNYFHLLRA